MAAKKAIASAIAAFALTVGVATPALATIRSVGGGTWDYGTGGGRVWSNFYHGSRDHASSVQGETYMTSRCMPKGYTSYARANDRFWVVDRSYYRFC